MRDYHRTCSHTRHCRWQLCLALALSAYCVVGFATSAHAVQPAKEGERIVRDSYVGVGAFEMIETSAKLTDIKGGPFAADIWGHVEAPDGTTIPLPAFYDGGATWRVRFSPYMTGQYSISIEDSDAITFIVGGEPGPGFVRRDPRVVQRFRLDNGDLYYPVGMNVGWGKAPSPVDVYEDIFPAMRDAGMNWARVWMTHFAGMNIDWNRRGKGPTSGTLNLKIAKRWDRIVDLAEENDLYFQFVLQHHGQYSTTVNPNWPKHPWNVKNGGFLETANAFFTDERAIALTRMKYRYVVARWGYSPSIMSWELFNEVQFADAMRDGETTSVAKWHGEMSDYLRSLDPTGRMVCTSSLPPESPIYAGADYYQPHLYKANMIDALINLPASPRELDRPIFYGEFGDSKMGYPEDGDVYKSGRLIVPLCWAGLMSDGAAGAAQQWYWDRVEASDLYNEFKSLTSFIKASRLAERNEELRAFEPAVQCEQRLPGVFVPGKNWAKNSVKKLRVMPNGRATKGLADVSSHIHGDHTKIANGFPQFLSIRATAPTTTTFTLNVQQIGKRGAEVRILVDGKEEAARVWPASEDDTNTDLDESLTVPLPKGDHTVVIKGVGADWLVMKSFSIDTGFIPALRAIGRRSEDAVTLWVHHRKGLADPNAKPATGRIRLNGLEDGTWRVVWWKMKEGGVKSEEEIVAKNGVLIIDTPAIKRHAAVIIERVGK